MNCCTAVWMFWVLGAGDPTVTVTGVDPVTPFRLSDTPGVVWGAPELGVELGVPGTAAPLIVFDEEYCVAPPLIVYCASTPACAYCVSSLSAPPGSLTLMKSVGVSGWPVARSDRTTVAGPFVGEAVTVAQTVAFWLELIELTRSWALAPAASEICWPSIVIESAEAGLVNWNVRWDALASWLTESW